MATTDMKDVPASADEHQELAATAAGLGPGQESTETNFTPASKTDSENTKVEDGPIKAGKNDSRRSSGPVEPFFDEKIKSQNEKKPNDAVVAPQASQEEEGIGTKRKVIITIALCMNLFLAALDQTIVATALPVIVHELGDAAGFAWCGSCFLIASATFIPSWGKFSDIWGRKPIMMTASVIFLVGSIVSATAKNMPALLAGRTVQGMGAGGIMSLVNITISDIVSVRERGKYLAFVGFTWAIASALGPVIGGLFTQKATWRWCFWLNLPVGGIAMTAIFFFLHLESPKISLMEGLKRVDWVGSLLAITGTCLLLIGLESGGVTNPWDSALVLCFLIIGVALFLLFIVVEWKVAKIPMMPTRLFTSRTNAAAYAVCFCHGQIFIASSFYLPLFFQSVLGANALLSGAYILPFVLTLSFGSASTGIFMSKTGKYQEPVWLGCVIMTVGVGMFTDWTRTSSLAKIILFQMVAGLGQGPLFQGPLIAIHSTIQPRDIATATASFAFIRNVSAAIGVSIGNSIFQNELQSHQSALAAQVGSQYAGLASGRQADANVELIQTFPNNIRYPLRNAYARSLSTMWWYFFAIGCCSIVCSLFIGKHDLSTTLNSSQPARMRKKEKEKEKTGDVNV